MYAGFFPSCPHTASYCFDINLLDLLLGLAAHSSISVHAMAAAVHDQHRRRGYVLTGPRVREHTALVRALMPSKNRPIQEGYRRTMQSALQWYDVLRSQVETEVVQRIERSRQAAAVPVAATCEASQNEGAVSPNGAMDSVEAMEEAVQEDVEAVEDMQEDAEAVDEGVKEAVDNEEAAPDRGSWKSRWTQVEADTSVQCVLIASPSQHVKMPTTWMSMRRAATQAGRTST